MSRTGRVLAIAGVVVANAAVQAVAIAGDPVPTVDAWFGLLVAASAAALVLSVWAVQLLLVHRAPRGALPLLGVVALGIVAAALAGVASALLVPVVLALGAIVLPAVASGARAGTAFRVFARAPVRAVLSVLAVLLLWGAGWLVALLLGFFVTGVVAAFATWVALGAAAALGLALWTRLWTRHGTPAREPRTTEPLRRAPIG